MNSKDIIAKRVASEILPNSVVNLGIGLPTHVSSFISASHNVLVQSENGLLGVCEKQVGLSNENIVDAGGSPISLVPGAASFDSALSFSLIRGGHIDVTVLGGLEVSSAGLLSNWIIPGKFVPGMGGAMDLTTKAKKVIVAMIHTNKGKPKLVSALSNPMTSKRPVDLVVTEKGVFQPCGDYFLVKEIAENSSIEDIEKHSDAKFRFANEGGYLTDKNEVIVDDFI